MAYQSVWYNLMTTTYYWYRIVGSGVGDDKNKAIVLLKKEFEDGILF